MESDDWVDSGMFEYLYNIAVNNNADVDKSNYYLYYSDLMKTSSQWNERRGIYSETLYKVVTDNDTKLDIMPTETRNSFINNTYNCRC